MMTGTHDEPMMLAHRLAEAFAALPEVVAVALAGSHATGASDERSDIDLYVYVSASIDLATRAALAGKGAEIDNQVWEPGDEWRDAATGIGVDVMYRDPEWITAQLDRVLIEYQASVGYSTCFWYNVRTSQALFDRDGWYEALRQRAQQDYPEPLRHAIIAKNHPILRERRSSYLHQIDSALARADRVSLNHRLTALLASYFDILFAVNRLAHPGEKRLVATAQTQCTLIPVSMADDIEALLTTDTNDVSWRARLVRLIDRLDDLLISEQLLPER